MGDSDALPLYGYIAAGRPIEAISNPEMIDVPAQLRSGKPCYVLEVRGDSMIEEGIPDGDWVVIEHRDHARNGEIVVALVDGEEATLKRLEANPARSCCTRPTAAWRRCTTARNACRSGRAGRPDAALPLIPGAHLPDACRRALQIPGQMPL